MRYSIKALFIGLLWICASYGFAFTINPMTAEITPSGTGTVTSFRLENDNDYPIAVIISIETRKVDEEGIEENMPAGEEFYIFPARLILEPNTVRIIKVQWRGPEIVPYEKSYRLIAEQVPVSFAQRSGSGIRILFRYRVSLYVTPPGARGKVSIHGIQVGEKEGVNGLLVTLQNEGDKHSVILNPKLLIKTKDRSVELPSEALSEMEGMNLLARTSRTLFIPWPEAMAGASYEADFSATFE